MGGLIDSVFGLRLVVLVGYGVRVGQASNIRWRRGPLWPVVVGVLLAVLGVVVSGSGGGWLLAGGIVVAGGGVLLTGAQTAVERRSQRAAGLERASRVATPGLDLPLLDTVDRQDLGVQRSDVVLAYRPRDQHQVLHDRLVEGRPVLLVGHSMAGKSRLAYEVAQDLYGGWPVLVPEPGQDLAPLIDDDGFREVVIWLDDLQAYLTAQSPFRLAWLRKLENKNCRVMATIRASEYEKFQPQGDIQPAGWDLIQRCVLVRLDEDPGEQDRLADSIEDARVAAGVRRYGLGEYLGGGYLALDRYQVGQRTHPLGTALLRAAADWRRLGLETISTENLRAVSTAHLSDRDQLAAAETFDQALAWASTNTAGIRLLEPAGSDTWIVFDYLLDHLATEQPTIPEAMWTRALSTITDPGQLT
ncbi:MAG: hypothetical protein ABI418_20640, partial [Jatrophihabitantaceae bacterium]